MASPHSGIYRLILQLQALRAFLLIKTEKDSLDLINVWRQHGTGFAISWWVTASQQIDPQRSESDIRVIAISAVLVITVYSSPWESLHFKHEDDLSGVICLFDFLVGIFMFAHCSYGKFAWQSFYHPKLLDVFCYRFVRPVSVESFISLFPKLPYHI
jgi:hypothetical protein